MVILVVYNNIVYINDEQNKNITGACEKVLIAATAYPAIYNFFKIYKQGLRYYLSDIMNVQEVVYIVGSVVNLYLQNTVTSQSF